MNYKTITTRKAQIPSKVTDNKLALRIIRAANKYKNSPRYKYNYYYKVAQELSLRIERVKLCLKHATAGSKNIFNKQKPWKIKVKYYYNIMTWEKNSAEAKRHRNIKNIDSSLKKANKVLDFIKHTYNTPIKLPLTNGRILKRYVRRSVEDYLHKYQLKHSKKSPVGKSTIYRHIKRREKGYKPMYFVRLYKQGRVKTAKKNFPKLPFESIENMPLPKKEPGHFQLDSVIGKARDIKAMGTALDIFTGRVAISLYNRKAEDFAKKHLKKIGKVAKTILVDNGSENTKLQKYMPSVKMYKCHPYSSWEKGAVENMHRLIRMIIPKGFSMNLLTEQAVQKIEDFANSYYRPRYIKKINS